MQGFAIYRLPHADSCTLVEGETQELLACTELNGQSGFVVAPFAVSQEEPIVLIRPDRVERRLLCQPTLDKWGSTLQQGQCPPEAMPRSGVTPQQGKDADGGRSYYSVDFANFHAHLLSGDFRKIVLARCSVEQAGGGVAPLELFWRACSNYPRLFISLVYTPQSGLWLTASPEILLEGSGPEWHTMALAGTIKLAGEQLSVEVPPVAWPTKDIQEQRYVATYITECLERFTNDFSEEGPATARAANLVHLRSDFTFRLSDSCHLGDLLHTLHPTPAVCGLPKRETFHFITHNEHTPRRYYSGFMGPLDLQSATHLYVSLRCMNLARDTYYLYAGGGLLKGSTEEQEWQETEAKLETMRSLLVHHS